MKRWLLLGLLLTGPSWSAPLQQGAVVGPSRMIKGAFAVQFASPPAPKINDLFRIEHNHHVLGRALVVFVSGADSIMVPMQGFHGQPSRSDTAIYVGHSTPAPGDAKGAGPAATSSPVSVPPPKPPPLHT